MPNTAKTLFISALIMVVQLAQAQDKLLDQWFEGVITMNDQTQISGYVNVNFTTQNVRYVAGEGSKEQAFGPSQISEVTMYKKAHQERHVSLNIGDGQKFYLWLGENEKLAFLFHICGTTLEYKSYKNSTVNSCTAKGYFVPRNAQTNPNETLLGFYGYFIALTPEGKQTLFYKETNREHPVPNRSYIHTKPEYLRFFQSYDPDIKSFMRKKGLDFKKDMSDIITRVLK